MGCCQKLDWLPITQWHAAKDRLTTIIQWDAARKRLTYNYKTMACLQEKDLHD